MYQSLTNMSLPAIPEREILARLGFNFHKTKFSPEEQQKFRRYLNDAFRLSAPRGRWAQYIIECNTGKELHLSNGVIIPGSDFISWIGDAPELWLGAVTIGPGILEKIKNLTSSDMALAAIYDAAASEIADAAMDFLQQYATRSYLRQGKHLHKRRYSPGYGDMPLSVQKDIFSMLELPSMGLSLSDNFIITPEKSVTAFAGLSHKIHEEQ